MSTPPWRIVYLEIEDEGIPFRYFIDRLATSDARAECSAFIELLKRRGDSLRGHRHLTHTKNLREFRGEHVRIFYKCVLPHLIVIIDGLFPGENGDLFDSIRRKAE